ncbi:long-chain fatty acid--CoA ligase, partial [Streptomyces sp. SID8455]|nr:long-chain fatty acid--CoA ligase [Streptomyces sp. SID8455]
LPDLAHVIVIDPAGVEPAEGDPEGWIITLADLEARGNELLAKTPDAVTERVSAITADQLATLIYTSGTTG